MTKIKYRTLTGSGDYVMKNTQAFLTDANAVTQAIKTNLLLLQGEWWEDTSNGLPLFQNILGQPGTPDKINAVDLIIKERILATQGVSEIIDFQSSYQNRTYTIEKCSVNTIYGTATVSGVNL